jgi:hypothetical protein
MSKGIIIVLIALMAPLRLWSQPSGQEWINFSQSYYKVTTATTGMHRLTRAQLQQAGLPVNTIDPRTFQLFYRGNELAIIVQGEGDGSFDENDFIEFVGKRNDGQSNTALYVSPEAQPNLYHNLYTDTTAYFLTWRPDGTRGKRMQAVPFQENTGSWANIGSHLSERLFLQTQQAYLGRTYPRANSTRLTVFDIGEGFTGQNFANTSRDFVIDQISNRVDGASTLEVLVQGRNNNPHITDVLVGPSAANLRLAGTFEFTAHEFVRAQINLQNSDFNTNGTLTVRITSRGQSPDQISLSYLYLKYARSMNMDGSSRQLLYIPPSANPRQLVLQNVLVGSRLIDITDFENPLRINTNLQAGNMRTVLAPSANERLLLLEGPGFVSPSIKRVRFRNFAGQSPNYLILTHERLTRPSTRYGNPVREYASYRRSVAGGGYDTLTAHTDLLFDQFYYGEPSSIAISNFLRFMHQQSQPEYLFIIGNGLYWFSRFYRIQGAIDDPAVRFKDFVPSAGHPGSDAFYTASLSADGIVPAMATGRLTAGSPQDVEHYLDKIRSMESLPLDQLWRKNHVLLSGGLNFVEIFNFRNFVNGFGNIMRGPYLGGEAKIVGKRTNNVVELINIAEEVNAGLQMITFFGHSGTQATDIDIGFVTNPVLGYNNRDKYPFILINGCSAGEIFSNQVETFGEDWMKARDRGAIGVMAHAAEGFSTELRIFSNLFYQTAFGDSSFIHQSMGKVHQEVMRRYVAARGEQFQPLDQAQVQQMILQGDPAYRLFPTQKPDFEINNQSLSVLSLDAEPLTARSDSFAIAVIVRNFGRTVDDSLAVRVRRTLPNGEQITYEPQRFASVFYQDTLHFVIRDNQEAFFGRNLFQVTLDPDNEIAELNEQNNSALVEFFFPLGATQNLFPYRDAVVTTTQVRLKAQSTDLLGLQRGFLLEIDTSATFNSPWKQQTSLQAEVLFEWPVSLLTHDSLTYFWRTKFEQPTETEVADWNTTAFTYVQNGSEGWLQRTAGQYVKEQLTGLEKEEGSGRLRFRTSTVEVSVQTSRQDGSSFTGIQVDGLELNGINPCVRNSLNLIAFDRASGDPYLVLFTQGQFDVLDPLSCGRRPQTINQIRNLQLNDPEQFLHRYIDGVDEGDFVLLVTNDSVNLQGMVANSRARLIQLGASGATLDGLQNGQPFILFGRKGMNEGEAQSVIGAQSRSNAANAIDLTTSFEAKFSSGSILTRPIGPAAAWQDLNFSISEFDDFSQFYGFDLLGVSATGVVTVLQTGLTDPQSIDFVDPQQYPFLRLRLRLSDPVTQTPPQLDYWGIRYETVPEGLLLPNRTFYTQSLSRPEGADLELPYRYINISDKDYSGPLEVNATYTNVQNRVERQFTKELPPLTAGEEVAGNLAIDTRGLAGRQDLRFRIVPKSGQEQFISNNQFNRSRQLHVLRDTLAPVIAVTFDGISIMDGDIVSPSPFITISLKDENPFLQKQDTSGVELFLSKQCEGCVLERVNLSGPQVRVIEATEDRPFTIEYQPENLENGIYTLRVNATDASNNVAGSEPYSINFEVINESTITHFYPYPNPFSTSCRFVFTLTGAEIPDEIKIQIMTVTGRVVREILQDEIGPLRIGNNITQYAWDGRDEFGDQLANGVYLYRVFVRINGQYVDQRATSADKAFKKGVGKLYILR